MCVVFQVRRDRASVEFEHNYSIEEGTELRRALVEALATTEKEDSDLLFAVMAVPEEAKEIEVPYMFQRYEYEYTHTRTPPHNHSHQYTYAVGRET